MKNLFQCIKSYLRSWLLRGHYVGVLKASHFKDSITYVDEQPRHPPSTQVHQAQFELLIDEISQVNVPLICGYFPPCPFSGHFWEIKWA